MTNHLPGLVLTPTPAMRAGTQHVWQHSQCGTVVVTPSTSPANSLGRCPNPSCRRPEAPWWRQQLPVAGLSAAAPANPAPLIRTRPVTMTAQTRSDPMTMRRATAETIRDGQGWYWPANSRTAHYYLKDHRTACGRGLVLLLPDDLDGFASPASSSDCAGCRRKVDAAHAALTPAHSMQPPSDIDLRWTCSACDWTASPSFATSEERTERFARHHQSTRPEPGR